MPSETTVPSHSQMVDVFRRIQLAHTQIVSTHAEAAAAGDSTRFEPLLVAPIQEDGVDEDVVGRKAATGRANAARSPPGSCQLTAVPQLVTAASRMSRAR